MKATYVRVSTIEQNVSRQLTGKEGKVYWDKISGMVPFEERPDAGRLLDDAQAGKIDEIEVHSIDLLGWMPLTYLENGKQNLVAKLLVSVLSTLAEIDYRNRWEPKAEGIARAKAEGKYQGRANRTGLSDGELIPKHADIIRELPDHLIRRMALAIAGLMIRGLLRLGKRALL